VEHPKWQTGVSHDLPWDAAPRRPQPPQGQSGKGTWGFTGGSGKLKGIKGKGPYTCAPSGDGSSCNVEGEYQLAK